MSAPEPAVREEELHAYVDGQLPSARLPAVIRHLDANPADAARVARYAEQRQALRVAFAEQDTDVLPPELDLSRLMEHRLQRRVVPWQIAATVLLALGLGGAGGWLLHAPSPPPRIATAMSVLEQQAFASHAVYSVEKRHAVEVGAADEDHLKRWLSNRLDRPVNPPVLSSVGFHLIGGRLLATERGGAAALFLYENEQGTRLSLLMRPMAPDLHAPQADMSDGKVNGCAWISRGMGYAVLVAAPDQELDKIYEQIKTELGTTG